MMNFNINENIDKLKTKLTGAMLMTLVTTTLLSAGIVNPAAAQIDPSQLDDIKALKVNNSQVITAGLPTAKQFESLQKSGVELVINLIPKDNSNYIENEAQLVSDAGMIYQNIEVDWQKPTIADVETFIALMEQNQDKSVLVHCAANYRASAFYYLYLATQESPISDDALADTLSPWGDLQKSYAKYPQWQKLIEDVKIKYADK
ncbi:protein tyrosine phosphatase family protein [Shewanella donghaensis]|uniref:protein tyrosine phosphatase family protein n=1 Tax=Shewanella donghaensis TaxID=238836 RepID=UPI001D044014|nr:protein tyrosine phosphatase family protein [Shewanella donghaensis]